MTHALFVYGSLQPGCENARELEEIEGQWQPASVKGCIKYLGWGSALGYPGLILADAVAPEDKAQVQDIKGQVLMSPQLEAHWPRLDAFEGSEYLRVTTHVTLADGSRLEAQVYTLNAS